MAKIEGYLDGIYNGHICGWAADIEKQNDALEIVLFINGIKVGETTANVLRPDLEKAGIGTGKYGFKFPLPDNFQTESDLVIDTLLKSTGTALAKSGQIFSRNETNDFVLKDAESDTLQSVIFLTTTTSATASAWRILSTLAKGKYIPNFYTEPFYQSGRVEDIRTDSPPEKGNLIFHNIANLLNLDMDFTKYRWIINIRDPRDFVCNQYHWFFQHTSPIKTEEELEKERAELRASGIDKYHLSKNFNGIFENFYKVVDRVPAKNIHFATYATLCLEFDTFVNGVAKFLGVAPTQEQLQAIEPERVDNLKANPKWIGHQWPGADIMPGRYKRELKPETISVLNERYAKILDFLSEHDHPSVRYTYQHHLSDTSQRKVLEGQNNWLFLANDTNHVIKQHTGQMLLSEKQINQWRLVLELRNAWLAAKKIPYVFLVPPDSHAIYNEFLPDDITPFSTRPILQLLNVLEEKDEVDFIYPLKEMQAGKQEMLVCHDTDSHWTHFGAFLAYEVLMKHLRKHLSNLKALKREDIDLKEMEFVGDLGDKYQPPRKGKTVLGKVALPKARVIFDNKIINRGNITIFEQEDKSLPCAVMFRDSYGMWIAPFIAESFSKLVVVASPLLEHDIVEQYMPDIVISELCERFFYQVPDDIGGEKATELMTTKTQAA